MKHADLPFLTGSDLAGRRNVAWRVELGKPHPGNPLIDTDKSWADGVSFNHGTALRDPVDGLWKLWGTAAPNATRDRRLAYYTSRDGVNWQIPPLGLCPFEGDPNTNIVLDFDSGGSSICATVLIDTAAAPDDRYEMFVLRRPDQPVRHQGKGVLGNVPLPNGSEGSERGVYRYRSPDGVRWRVVAGPVLRNDPHDPFLLAEGCTADNIWVHRETDGTYVGYHKAQLHSLPGGMVPYELSPGGCRIISRKTSMDGTCWSGPEPIFIPDWRDPPDTQFMEVAVTPMAGGLVGIVTVYHALQQTIDFQFAASRDGRRWWRPDRRPIISPPALGDPGGGMMWGTHHMIEEGDDLHYYYGGLEGLHGDMFTTGQAEDARSKGLSFKDMTTLHGELHNRAPGEAIQHGNLCRATWNRGRLWGLVVLSGGNCEGEAVLAAPMKRGQVLEINARTWRDGEVLAELVNGDGESVPGFQRSDAAAVRGDSMRTTVTWRGETACPAEGLHVRLILRRACVYGVGFEDPD